MKKILSLSAFVLLAHFAFSQWQTQTGTNNIYNTNSGYVGIGTQTPNSPLHVVGQILGDVTNSPAFVSHSNLGVVIQQGNIGGDFVSATNYLGIFAYNMNYDGTNWYRRNQYGTAWANVMNYYYYDVTYAPAGNNNTPANSVVTPTTYMRITSGGNVLIGKTTQANSSYMLDVNGYVRANQVVVNSSGADYVFDPGYSLMPLNDLGKFVHANHHLPGIASAQEMSDKGLNVGETETTLLKKVEELTLYMLDQQKQIEQLKKQNKRLEKLIKKKA